MGDNSPRGMLTTTDKAFLSGEKQYEHRQSRYKRRNGIRERVRNTISDFPIFWEKTPIEERKKVYGDLDLPRADLARGLSDSPMAPLEALCAVAYEVALHNEIPPEFIFHNAVKKVESQRLLSDESNRRVNVDLSFDVTIEEANERNVIEALKRLDHGETIFDLDRKALSDLISYSIMSGSIDQDTLVEAAREEVQREREEYTNDQEDRGPEE